MMRDEDVLAADEADALGFVVDSPFSHRNLDHAEARRLIRLANAFQTTVAVTAERDFDTLSKIIEDVEPRALQFPFRPAPGTLERLREKYPRVRYVLSCRPTIAHATPDDVRTIIIDNAADDGYGGTGEITDWKRAAVMRDALVPRHLILAGGLTPENVADAIATVRPWGVDVSSGVETDRAKDPAKITAFIEAAREAGKKLDT